MNTNNNKGIECKCEEDHNGNCYFCGRNMLSSPLTMEERFDEQCDAVCSVCKSGIKVFIRQEISSAVSQALEEQREETLEEIDIMLAEEPSNYPTPQGQEAVYGVLERLKERLLSNNK